MCGIAGAFDFRGRPLDTARLTAMADVQRHRGPDGEGAVLFDIEGRGAEWWDRGAPPLAGSDGGLVHRRLAIVDLSVRARQPMHDGSGRVWISYNGEIYNYVELMAELQALGHRFHSRSDTEVIVHAYREWGTACVTRLNGIFAFALWDCDRRRLYCARDRLGVKPFYYRFENGRLTFASEIKAILAYERARPTAHLPALGDYLCFSFVPSAETFFHGVLALPPGSVLLADADGVRVAPYWRPRFEDDETDEATLVAELRDLLDDAIGLQLRSDVPVGAHLSGGIDSSAVCCLAARRVPRLKTFTARFAAGGFFDESPYARLVSTTIGSDHHEIVPPDDAVAELLPRIVYHLDQPVEGPAVFGKFHVAQLVGSHVKVVLGGQGGDELFGGYDWYVKALFTAACFDGRRLLGDGATLRFALQCLRGESWRRLARSLWSNAGSSDVAAIFRRNWSRVRPGAERTLMRRELFDGAPTAAERFAAAFEALPERDPAERMFHFDLRHYLEALLHSEDRLSMAFSVESRVPLLDHRIVELAARAGRGRKAVPGRAKDLLRRAVAGVVPTAVLARRDKRGFPTPVDGWLGDRRLALIERFVLDGGDFAATVFDRDRVRALVRQPVAIGSARAETLWRIVNVSAWGSRFEVAV